MMLHQGLLLKVEVPLKEMNTNLLLEIVRFICEEMGCMRSDTTISFICLWFIELGNVTHIPYWFVKKPKRRVKLQFTSFCPSVLTSNIRDQLGCLQDGF